MDAYRHIQFHGQTEIHIVSRVVRCNPCILQGDLTDGLQFSGPGAVADHVKKSPVGAGPAERHGGDETLGVRSYPFIDPLREIPSVMA